jgi:hypothetical protein
VAHSLFFAGLEAATEVDAKPAAGEAVRKRATGALGRADIELDRIKIEPAHAVVEGAEAVRDCAANALGVEVQRDVEAYVLHVHNAVARITGLVAGQGKCACESRNQAVVAAAHGALDQLFNKIHASLSIGLRLTRRSPDHRHTPCAEYWLWFSPPPIV